MLRIFVTGDNHIGKSYDMYPDETKSVILSSRIDALKTMVSMANEEKCGLFAITGDLFEKVNIPSRKDAARVVEALSGFGGSVVIIPGNHDYYTEQSDVWKAFDEAVNTQGASNVMLLKEDRPYRFTVGDDEAVIYPAVCRSDDSQGKNGLEWIGSAERSQDAYLIGMAHGAVEGESLDSEGKYYSMTRDELNGLGMDAWLIGHTHVPFPRALGTEYAPTDERIFNAGSHVQTDVNNNTEGVCFVVEIGEDRSIRAKKVVTGNIRFREVTVGSEAGKLAEKLTDALEALPARTVVTLTVCGEGSDEERSGWRDTVREVYLRLGLLAGKETKCGLLPAISRETIEADYAEGTFPARLLTRLLDDHDAARLAKSLLETIKED